MGKEPLVSVIITTYNRSEFLEEAILSVVNQSYTNIEILVIDDGSIENYAKVICNKYKKCNFFFKENGGLSSARNFGINEAKGDYIAFLDDDDFWRDDKLKKQVDALNSFKDIDCIHSSAAVVNENGDKTGEIIGASVNKVHKRSGNVFWDALGVWVVKSPTPLIRRKIFTKDLMFDKDIKIGEDVDFYQRMFYYHKVLYINEPLAYYREYNNKERLSLQREKYIGLEKKIYNNFVKMGVKNPLVLNKITSRLLVSGVNRFNFLNPQNKIKLSFLDKYIYPIRTLNKINFSKK